MKRLKVSPQTPTHPFSNRTLDLPRSSLKTLQWYPKVSPFCQIRTYVRYTMLIHAQTHRREVVVVEGRAWQEVSVEVE